MTFPLWIELVYALVVLSLSGLAFAELRRRRAMRDCKCVSCTVDRQCPLFSNTELFLFVPLGTLVFIVMVAHIIAAVMTGSAL